MPDLHESARTYLEASGFRVLRSADGVLDATRDTADGRRERVLTWTLASAVRPSEHLSATERTARGALENRLLRGIEREMRAATGATGYLLVERRLGLSQRFVSEATRLLGSRGGIRVPIEFFDTPYKKDGDGAEQKRRSRRARTSLDDVLTRAARTRRVGQPFARRGGPEAGDKIAVEGDLVEHLETEMMDPSPGARLTVIDGSAGGGKTVAFNALVTSLYREFLAAKAEKQRRRRPIVFLPEHIRGRQTGYVDDVLGAVAETDIAGVASPDQMKWLLVNGFAIWLFDGLDEFYAGSPDFFRFVETVLAAPGSQAQLVIATRDSLLTSSASLGGFLQSQLQSGGRTEILELAPWDAAAWREMAWLELENGKAGRKKSERVNLFVHALGSEPVAALARLPFYCSVLLDRFKADGRLPADAIELLDLIVERMLQREHDKGIFEWQDFLDIDALTDVIRNQADALDDLDQARDGEIDVGGALERMLVSQGRDSLMELIGGMAHQFRRTPDSSHDPGLPVETVRDLFGASYVSSTLDAEDTRRLLTVLVQFAFFGRGAAAGAIDFTHPLVADYLAARYAVALLRREMQPHGHGQGRSGDKRPMQAVLQAIGTAEFARGSIFHRYLAREIAGDPRLRNDLELARRSGELGRANVTAALALLLGPGK